MPQERDFRKGIIALSNKALDVMEKYLGGQVLDGKLVQYAERMISAGIKFSIRDQLDEQAKRQQALKLVTLVPPEQRQAYISQTFPSVKPFLLSRPATRTQEESSTGESEVS
ncbi:MAG: hypothetical protein ACLQVJ_07950 [Syntrophobacteraceae bacterium]